MTDSPYDTVSIGTGALADLSGGIAIGHQAGYLTGTGTNSVCLGKYSGFSNNNTTVNVGYSATGNYNTGMGDRALRSMTSAEKNSAFGMAALINNTTGSYNTGLGSSALESNTTASNNTFKIF